MLISEAGHLELEGLNFVPDIFQLIGKFGIKGDLAGAIGLCTKLCFCRRTIFVDFIPTIACKGLDAFG